MNFKKQFNEYRSTTDNRTYKLLRWADEGLCCMGCINRGRRGWYFRREDEARRASSYPSWKLVSKNSKQYNIKPITFITEGDCGFYDRSKVADIIW